jgi:hypothetical protein
MRILLQLQPSVDSTTSAETDDSDYFERMAKSAVVANVSKCRNTSSDDTSDAAAAAERTLALTRLYHQNCRSKHCGFCLSKYSGQESTRHYWKHLPPSPQFQPQTKGNALEDATAGMIGPAAKWNETVTRSNLCRHPIRHTKKHIITTLIEKDSTGRPTLPCSRHSPEVAERIREGIKNAIGNTEEGDWSFNGSPPFSSTETAKTTIPRAIVFSEERDRKRRKSFHAVM